MTEAPPSTPRARRPGPWVSILIGACVAVIFGLAGLGVGVYIALVREGVLNPAWTAGNIARTRERAGHIIGALERYRAEHGVYPERLTDLAPAYLADVPAPTAGVDRWTYAATHAGEEFLLQFSANRHADPTSWYDSRHDGWFIQESGSVAAD